jgi:hypothetical protein
MTAPDASHEETFPWERRDELGLAATDHQSTVDRV